MKNSNYIWLAAGQAASTAAVQVIPMLSLPVRGYAVYAVTYLAFAAVLSLQNATLCDVWARLVRRTGSSSSQLFPFRAAHTALGVFGGIAGGLVALSVSGQWTLSLAAGAATALAMYRSGIAYRLVVADQIRRAGLSELLGAFAAATASVAFLSLGAFTVSTALLSWAIGALCASLAAGIAPVADPRAAARWFSDNRRDIGLLSAETAIKTVETVGTPLLVGAVGGALPLALHRAASSLTYPVRLVIEILRARIISGAIGGSLRAVLTIGMIGALTGAAVAAGLVVLDRWDLLAEGTIVDALAPHALAVGAWLFTMAVSSFVQFVGRGSLSGRRLLVRRLANTVVVLGVTATGVLLLGWGAVIWSAAFAELLAAFLWIPGRIRRGIDTAEETDSDLLDPTTSDGPTVDRPPVGIGAGTPRTSPGQ